MEAIALLRTYRRPIGLLGSLMLLIGLFFPIVNYPGVGGYSFLGYSIVMTLLLLILAIVSAVLAGVNVFRGLWVTGGLAAAACIYAFAQIEMAISRGAQPSHNVIDMIVGAATNPTSIGAGWIVLFPSVVILLLVAAIPEAKPSPTMTTAAAKPLQAVAKRPDGEIVVETAEPRASDA